MLVLISCLYYLLINTQFRYSCVTVLDAGPQQLNASFLSFVIGKLPFLVRVFLCAVQEWVVTVLVWDLASSFGI